MNAVSVKAARPGEIRGRGGVATIIRALCPAPSGRGFSLSSPMHPDHDDHDDRADFDDFEDDRPSKSQLKRDMDALQALGAELLTLPEKRVAALDLPEALMDAIKEGRRIVAGTARSG